MYKLVLEKAVEPEIRLPTFAGSSKKEESSRKTSTSALLTMPKPLTMWFTINCGTFWKRWECQTTWPASWEICIQSEKEYIKAVYCHPAYLTYMQSTAWEMLGWMKHKLESRLLEEISINSGMQMIPPYGREWRKTKSLLMKVKEKNEKVDLNSTFRKLRSWHPVPSMVNRCRNSGNSDRLYYWGLRNHCRWWLQAWH